MPRRALLILFGVAVLAAAWAFHKYAPRQHNPLKRLVIADPIGAATYHKLNRLSASPNTCLEILDQAGVFYQKLDDTRPRKACGFYNAVSLDKSFASYSASSLRMTCAMTAALAVWEHNVVLPTAEKILGSPIKRIETYGTYSCRRINGAMSGRWSEHATANAIDISGFRLADGRLISVKHDWGKRTPEGKFLRKVHHGSCRVFSVSLSPDYNTAHHDHFHFDMGGGDLCG